jgi:hypothetical protein
MIKIISIILLIIVLAGCANTSISGSFVKEEAEKRDALKEKLCYDSDDGDNIDITGTVSIKAGDSLFDYSDYCINKISLMEYFCEDDTYKSNTYKCRNSCVNGACR